MPFHLGATGSHDKKAGRVVLAPTSKHYRTYYAAALTWVSIAHAGNGTNLIGFGVESNLLAGADVALSRDTGAASTNPAGLTQINGLALDNHFGIASGRGVGHRDQFGNDVRVDNEFALVGSFGFARRAPGSPLAFGVGLFGQGGAGYVYKDLNTAFGTRDELSALLRIAKVSPAIAYQFNDRLSLGVALPIVYADLRQELFPDTSSFNAAQPARSFFGSTLTGADAASVGVKLGLKYRASDTLTLGFTFANRVDLTLGGGKLKVNYNDIGLGRVTYRDAEVSGLQLPQELALGAARRLGDRWLLSLKWTWLDWSKAFRASTLSASSPDNPAAPPSIRNSAKLDWRDQHVIAVGLAFEATPATTLYAGYNYGANPIPKHTTNPLLAAVTEQHLTLGMTRRMSERWLFSLGVEHDFAKSVTYTNPELPFGINARERNEVTALHLGLGRRW